MRKNLKRIAVLMSLLLLIQTSYVVYAEEEISISYTGTVKDPSGDLYNGQAQVYFSDGGEFISKEVFITDGLFDLSLTDSVRVMYIVCQDYANTITVRRSSPFEGLNYDFGELHFQEPLLSGTVTDYRGNQSNKTYINVKHLLFNGTLIIPVNEDGTYQIASFIDEELGGLGISTLEAVDESVLPHAYSESAQFSSRNGAIDLICDQRDGIDSSEIKSIVVLPKVIEASGQETKTMSFSGYEGLANELFIPMNSVSELEVKIYGHDGNILNVSGDIISFEIKDDTSDTPAELEGFELTAGIDDSLLSKMYMTVNIGDDYSENFMCTFYDGKIVMLNIMDVTNKPVSGMSEVIVGTYDGHDSKYYHSYVQSFHGFAPVIVPVGNEDVISYDVVVSPVDSYVVDNANSQVLHLTDYLAADETNDISSAIDISYQSPVTAVSVIDGNGEMIEEEGTGYYDFVIENSDNSISEFRLIRDMNSITNFAPLTENGVESFDIDLLLENVEYTLENIPFDYSEIKLREGLEPIFIPFEEPVIDTNVAYFDIAVVDSITGDDVEGSYVNLGNFGIMSNVFIPENNDNCEIEFTLYNSDDQVIDYSDMSPTADVYEDRENSPAIDQNGFNITTNDAEFTERNSEWMDVSIGNFYHYLSIEAYEGDIAEVSVLNSLGEQYEDGQLLYVDYFDDEGSVYSDFSFFYRTPNDKTPFVLRSGYDDLESVKIISVPTYDYYTGREANSVQRDITEFVTQGSNRVIDVGVLSHQKPSIIGTVNKPEMDWADYYQYVTVVFYTSVNGVLENPVSFYPSEDMSNLNLAPVSDEHNVIDIDIYAKDFNLDREEEKLLRLMLPNTTDEFLYDIDIDFIQDPVEEPTPTPTPTPVEDPVPTPKPVTPPASTGSVAPPVVIVDDQLAQTIPDSLEAGIRTTTSILGQGELSSVATVSPKTMITKGEKGLVVAGTHANLSFDELTLKGFAKITSSDLEIEVKKVSKSGLSTDVIKTIGDHDIFDFTVKYGNKIITNFDGSVTVTIPYTLQDGEDEDAIVIYYINDNGDLEVVNNCTYNDGFLSFETNHFSRYVIAHNLVSFTDVSGWYVDYVEFLAARNVMNGKGLAGFDPLGILTRAEAVQIVANLSGEELEAVTSNPFDDVDVDKWYAEAIAWAKSEELISGEDGKYNPMEAITREDLAVLIAKYIENYKGETFDEVNDKIDFLDKEKISDYAEESVTKLQLSGIINGTPEGEFLPLNNASRAEVAKMFTVMLQNHR